MCKVEKSVLGFGDSGFPMATLSHPTMVAQNCTKSIPLN